MRNALYRVRPVRFRRWVGLSAGSVALAILAAVPAHAAVTAATDTNPDPRIFEVYLTADEQDVTIAGETVHALVYRDDPPAPFVPAPPGIPAPQIVVNVGDLIIAHFRSELDHENTSIHWHGIEVDNNSDGTGLTMDRVEPGEEYIYRFFVPRPGVTWYHPHMIPTHQDMSGMYGPLIVLDPKEADLEAAGRIPSNVRTLMLADINFDANGNVGFLQPGMSGPEFHDVNHRLETCAMSLMAGMRNPLVCVVPLGNTVLVNGQEPNMATSRIVARSGEGLRLRLVNSSIARYYRLKVTDNLDNTLYRLAGEGELLEFVRVDGGILGLWDTMYDKGEILLAPGDRADVVVVPQGNNGDIIKLVGSSFRSNFMNPDGGNEFDIAYIEIQGTQTPAFQIAEGDPLGGAGSVENLKGLSVSHLQIPPTSIGSTNETITFTVNVTSPSSRPGPSIDGVFGTFEDSGPDFTIVPYIDSSRFAFVDDVLELTINNATLAHHPFHLHGVFFQPIRMLDAIGNTLYTFTHNEFVDTFNIPNGYQLVFRLRFQDRANICDDQTKPGACTTTSFGGASGRWVYHCHILPHAALGMVSEIVTTYKTPPPTTRTVAIDKVGFGAGSVTSLPDALMCGDTCSAGFPEGTVVNLVVAPEPGSYFAGFAGPPDCADGSVTLSADVVCTARFGVGMAPAVGSGVVDYVPNFLDLDLDGRGDAVQYSPGLGGATSYLEDGTAPRGAASILLPSGTHPWSAGWTIKSGDFNGDGRSDLFFYDEVLGGWFKGISTTPQGGPVSYSYAGGTWSPGWSVAILDLNGDGLADVFLYNPATGDWYRGTSTGDGTGDFSFSAGRWSPGWQIHQMRLDGDALTDLLLYDPASGMWFRALNDGASGFTFANGTWSPGWQIAPGSYNSDALDDIFLYNSSTGDWYVGMNTGTGWAFTGGRFSPAWTVDTGDFNGDGRTDLFLYNVMTGEWYESLADGAGGWAYVHGSWSPGWEVTVTSFNQDNLADVLLYNPVTGAYFQGETTTPGTFVYAGGTWDVGQSVIATTP